MKTPSVHEMHFLKEKIDQLKSRGVPEATGLQGLGSPVGYKREGGNKPFSNNYLGLPTTRG